MLCFIHHIYYYSILVLYYTTYRSHLLLRISEQVQLRLSLSQSQKYEDVYCDGQVL